jgi:hypothetical protein
MMFCRRHKSWPRQITPRLDGLVDLRYGRIKSGYDLAFPQPMGPFALPSDVAVRGDAGGRAGRVFQRRPT